MEPSSAYETQDPCRAARAARSARAPSGRERSLGNGAVHGKASDRAGIDGELAAGRFDTSVDERQTAAERDARVRAGRVVPEIEAQPPAAFLHRQSDRGLVAVPRHAVL